MDFPLDVNQVQLVGALENPPEMKYTQNNAPFLKFRVTVTETFRKQDGQLSENKTTLTVIAWRKLAEQLSTTIGQGSRVVVRGKLQNRSYENEMGEQKWVMQVNAHQVFPLDQPAQGGYHQPPQQQPPAQYQPPAQQPPVQQPQGQYQPPQQQPPVQQPQGQYQPPQQQPPAQQPQGQYQPPAQQPGGPVPEDDLPF